MKAVMIWSIALLISACSGGSEEQVATEALTSNEQAAPAGSWHEYNHGDYTVYAPESWEMDISGRMGTMFILFSPQDSNDHFFRENVNMVMEDVSAYGTSLEEYLEQSKGMLEEYITDLSNLEITQRNDRYWLSYQGTQGRLTLHFRQMMVKHDEKVYILTFTAPSGVDTGNEQVAEKIMESFSFN